MVTYKGAEIIVEYLLRERVPYLFGTCGHGNLGLLDALFDHQDEIRTVLVHHESVAGFMADAYFRVAHRPVATYSSCGPGTANMPVALASALMDSSALLALTGNVPTSQFSRGPFQELGRHHQADVTTALRPYVKHSYQATRPEQLPLMLRQAFGTMLTGRPGPVHLDVPLDVWVEAADVEIPDPRSWRDGITSGTAPAQELVGQVLHLLLSAERPVIVAGHGVEIAQAEADLRAFAEAVGIPVAVTPLGKGVMDMRSPLSLGQTGRNGTYMANQSTRTADVILALGTRFDDRSTSSWMPGYTYDIPPTRLIHVDIDPQEIGRNYPPAIGVVADARATLRALRARISGRADADPAHRAPWRERIATWRAEWTRATQPGRISDAVPIHPQRVLADLRAVLPAEGILLSDVGVHHNWIVQEWQAFEPRTVLQSWGFASMGFGVAGVLGAKLAAPERPALAVVGDGGFLMLPSVVSTAVEYGIPAVWLVWNNYGFCSIRDQQRGYFGAERELVTSFRHEASGELYTPDYAAMARSMGAEGDMVEKPEDLAGLIDHAVSSGRPYVLDVRVDREIRPPATGSWDLPPLPHPQPDPQWTGA
jgi:acetolactate synthase-1/2/3 large subunit